MACRHYLGSLALALSAWGCADAEQLPPPAATAPATHSASFVGYIYDGATGARVPSFGISVTVGATTTAGTVDAEGRYLLGPIGVWDDFTVGVESEGYRIFRSHNARVGLPPELGESGDIAELSTQQTLHFDAYLFPSSLASPAATLTIASPLASADPAGSIRLRPTAPSLLQNDPAEEPSGVPGQLWTNDEDLQTETVSEDFSGGQLALTAGDLVYGVHYQVSIFDVAGHQPFEGSYTAGVEIDKTFLLEEALTEPLAVVTETSDSCTPPPSPSSTMGAVVTIEFNHMIELADPDAAAEALDDSLSIVSPDLDGDTTLNTLLPDLSSSIQEHGVTISAADQTLTIRFNPSVGLETIDTDDPIDSVTYDNLAAVMVQRAGAPGSVVSLASLLGFSSIQCD